MRTLLSYGVDVNTRNVEGNTALHYAVHRRPPEVAKLLLSHEADPSIASRSEQTPMAKVAYDDRSVEEAVKALLKDHAIRRNSSVRWSPSRRQLKQISAAL